jgi:hypothetical protein
MKTSFKHLFFALLALLAGGLIFTACTKEDVNPIGEDQELEARVGSGFFNVTAYWEEGATTMLNSTVHTAQNNTITVWNDFSNGTSGRIGFQRWDQSRNASFGRTNGAGDNGDAAHAFAFKTTGWTANVPFAFGTKGSREAIWTPLRKGGVPLVYMGLFATDNGAGDEDPVPGSIEVGDFRAIDGDFNIYGVNRPGKVVFQKWNGSSWQQIGRTNGSGDDGNLLAFTKVKVRTGYTVSGGKVTAETWEDIPVAKIERSGGVKRLITDLPGGNIGTAKMYEY